MYLEIYIVFNILLEIVEHDDISLIRQTIFGNKSILPIRKGFGSFCFEPMA